MADETAAERFDRDFGQQPDGDDTGGRKDRDLNHQPQERAERLYVNAADNTTPADDNLVEE